MSYDLSVKSAPCSHMQSLERYVVSPYDNRTLLYAYDLSRFMRGPLNGASLVRVFFGGKEVLPNHPQYGWSIVRDTSDLSIDEQFFKIVFNKSVRTIVPLIEVSYRTTVTYCLRCNATGQTNDMQITKSGSLLRIWGRDKLIQRGLKWILSSRWPFYQNMACRIKDYIGKKFGTAITETDISQETMNALTNMRNVQRAQASVQTLDDAEILSSIQNVNALEDPNNPTLVRVGVSVTSGQKSTNLQSINFALRANK